MRRTATAALLSAALAMTVLAAGVSGASGSGPKCADLEFVDVNYRLNTDGTYTLSVDLILAQEAPACKQITYTLTIAGTGSTGSESIVRTQKGDKDFIETFSDNDNQVCISATTSAAGGHIHDSAPDTGGCLVLQEDTSGGRVGFG